MLVEVALPPGVYGVGTAYQAKGRWLVWEHVRCPDGVNLQPIGGYAQRSASLLTGVCRAAIAWKENPPALTRWFAFATHSHLYAMNAGGTLSDITPAGLTVGRADATTGGGYGAGAYGAGTYGTARADSSNIQPATVCTLDTWGEDLLFNSPADGRLWKWQRNVAVLPAVIAGAPTDCDGLSVQEDRFIFAYRGRNIAWCDQENDTDWTATSLNQAGDIDLDTRGTFRRGFRVNGAHLHLTEVEAYTSTYRGDEFVHGFTRAGDDCGIIATGAGVAFDGRAAWMGAKRFHLYEGGYVRSIPCEVVDRVFADLNTQQVSKITCWHNADRREIWWHYPDESSTENNKYVFWSYDSAVPHWGTGTLARTAGVAPGIFKYPVLVDPDGAVWDHEQGWTWDVTPYAESGPLEIGGGEMRMLVTGFIPDEGVQGQSEVTLIGAESPNGEATEYGPFENAGDQVDCLASARQFAVRISFTTPADARAGAFRFYAKPVGRR